MAARAALRRPASTRRAARTKRSAALRQPKLLKADETAAWYRGKEFSSDWTSWHFPKWIKLLAPYRRRRMRVLEIGSWEGRSALFFLNYLPQATLTCIDTFAGGQEHREAAERDTNEARKLLALEARFDRNTAAVASRIEKIKAASPDALIQLGLADRRFDLAYIDGGHRAQEVYLDAMLTWPLMARKGLMIFDDYQWDETAAPLDHPAPGIDAFLRAIKGQYRFALRGYQIGIVKTAP